MRLAELRSLTPREYHARRAAERHAAREVDRERTLAATRRAIRELASREPELRAAYLFGSVLRPGQFRPDSDIDVAVICDAATELRVWRALRDDLGREVDVRPCTGALARVVDLEGERVYP